MTYQAICTHHLAERVWSEQLHLILKQWVTLMGETDALEETVSAENCEHVCAEDDAFVLF
jgi:hypothetical protein